MVSYTPLAGRRRIPARGSRFKIRRLALPKPMLKHEFPGSPAPDDQPPSRAQPLRLSAARPPRLGCGCPRRFPFAAHGSARCRTPDPADDTGRFLVVGWPRHGRIQPTAAPGHERALPVLPEIPPGPGCTRRGDETMSTSRSVPTPSAGSSEEMREPLGDCRPALETRGAPHHSMAPQLCYYLVDRRVQEAKIYTLTLPVRGPNK